MRKNACVLILWAVMSTVCLPLTAYASEVTEETNNTMTIVKEDIVYRMDEPAAGETPQYMSDIVDNDMVTIIDESWGSYGFFGWNLMDENDKFQEGYEYVYILELEAGNGYMFDTNIGFNISGVEWFDIDLQIEEKTLRFKACVTIGTRETINIELEFDKDPQAYAVFPELETISCPFEYEIIRDEWMDSEDHILYNQRMKYGKGYYHKIVIAVPESISGASEITAEVKNEGIKSNFVRGFYDYENERYEIEIENYMYFEFPFEAIFENSDDGKFEFYIWVKLLFAGVFVIMAVLVSIKVYKNRRYR